MASFSDQVLIDILKKAARRVNRKLCLMGSDRIVIDDFGNMTQPDPETDNGQTLYDLVLLQAECLISTREYQEELRENSAGVLVRDGEQTVDTRGVGVARGTFYDSENSPCSELRRELMYEKMKRQGGGYGPGNLVW